MTTSVHLNDTAYAERKRVVNSQHIPIYSSAQMTTEETLCWQLVNTKTYKTLSLQQGRFSFFPHRTQQLFWIGCAALTFCPWSSWSLWSSWMRSSHYDLETFRLKHLKHRISMIDNLFTFEMPFMIEEWVGRICQLILKVAYHFRQEANLEMWRLTLVSIQNFQEDAPGNS